MSTLSYRERFRRWRRTMRRRAGRWFARQGWIARLALFVGAAVAVAVVSKVVPEALERPAPDPPRFRISTEPNPDRIDIESVSVGASYVTETPIAEVGPPPRGQDACVGRFEWAEDYDAVQADFSTMRFRVDATTDEPVYITGVNVVVDDRDPPLAGVHLACPGRGVDVPERTVFADLSNEVPSVAVKDKDGTPVDSIHFVVRKGEAESFLTTVSAPTCDCRWHIEVRLEVDGEEHTEVVDDDGRPFRTTSTDDAPTYRWRDGGWVKLEPVTVEPPPAAGDCLYIEAGDVDATVGGHWSLLRVQSVEGYGQPPDLETTCFFQSDDNPDDPVPPYVSVRVLATHDQQRAAVALDDLVTSYRQLGPGIQLRDLGDEAYAFDRAVISRRGTEVLTVEADGIDQPRDAVRALAAITAERYWG